MPRIRKYRNTPISIRPSKGLESAIEELASELNLTRNALLCELIRRGLVTAKMIPIAPKPKESFADTVREIQRQVKASNQEIREILKGLKS